MSEYHPTTDHLEDFVERSLPEGDRVIVESHLLGCPSCRARVEDVQSLFSALAGMRHFEPTVGFANRVMARVHVAPRAAWQEWTDRATALAARITPRTNYGWSIAVAMLALPVLLGGGAIAWLLSRDYITMQTLFAWTWEQVTGGVQAIGATAIAALLQTQVAAWIVANVTLLVESIGVTGVSTVLAAIGATTVYAAWFLYRNLFRSSNSRESRYVIYSF